MRHKQLAFLFICNYLPPFVGMGLFPLLPLYAAQFGATRTIIGIYYAVVYQTFAPEDARRLTQQKERFQRFPQPRP